MLAMLADIDVSGGDVIEALLFVFVALLIAWVIVQVIRRF